MPIVCVLDTLRADVEEYLGDFAAESEFRSTSGGDKLGSYTSSELAITASALALVEVQCSQH